MLPLDPPAALISQIAPREGADISINGKKMQAPWRWEESSPPKLWLPLDVLEAQFGVNKTSAANGSLNLSWFGRDLGVPVQNQRSLQDEVAVEVVDLFRNLGVDSKVKTSPVGGSTLELELPAARVLQVRNSRLHSQLRVVLDLSGPTLVQKQGENLQLNLSNPELALRGLRQQGLAAQMNGSLLQLSSQGITNFSLGSPARLVFDQTLQRASISPPAIEPLAAAANPNAAPAMEQKILNLNGQRYQISFVRFDPIRSAYALVPLSRKQMEGLGSLAGLARAQGALAALNGGFFNRVRELPLGGLREQGAWLSGPILNRGAIAWQVGQQPIFSNVRLEEWLSDSQGNRWPLGALNSGYVQKGFGHYNSLWGAVYRPITSQESGWILENGRVLEILSAEQMAPGVPLRQGQALVVARGGSQLPLQPGDAVQLQRDLFPERMNSMPNLLQAGPLLLNQGQVVLNGAAENFSPAFMEQRAPRSVVAGDGDQVWLIALEGLDNRGPTLAESAELLLQLGLKQALNLDGGSSTALLVEGREGKSGRGIGSAIHNGLGLVVRTNR